MDGAKLKFNDAKFDVIIASDILEHIENDYSALIEWNRIMKSNGKLIVFVPAFNFLWSGLDEANRHYRRYSRSSLIKALEGVHFKAPAARTRPLAEIQF